MSNVIQIKRGTTVPGKGILADGELGYSTRLRRFYIGAKEKDSLEEEIIVSREVNYLPAKFLNSPTSGMSESELPSGVNNGSAQKFRVDCAVRFYGPTSGAAIDLAGEMVVKKYSDTRIGKITVGNGGFLIMQSGSTCTLYQPTIKSETQSYQLVNSGNFLRLDIPYANNDDILERGGFVGGTFLGPSSWAGANLGSPYLPWRSLFVKEINPVYDPGGGKQKLAHNLTIGGGSLTINTAIILNSNSYGSSPPSSATSGQLYFVEAV